MVVFFSRPNPSRLSRVVVLDATLRRYLRRDGGRHGHGQVESQPRAANRQEAPRHAIHDDDDTHASVRPSQGGSLSLSLLMARSRARVKMSKLDRHRRSMYSSALVHVVYFWFRTIRRCCQEALKKVFSEGGSTWLVEWGWTIPGKGAEAHRVLLA